MNLTIKDAHSPKNPLFRIMNGDKELCLTRSYEDALLIQKAFYNKEESNFIFTDKNMILEKILQKIHEITKIDLKTNYDRFKEESNLRMIYCKIANEYGISLKKIGDLINRNHTTVYWAINKFSDYYKTDPNFRELYNEIKNSIL